ncbi:MAG: hypothetical protein SGPRY_013509, partial [Prymnesium sp.]
MPEDFMKNLASSWNVAFARDRNVKGWLRTGLNPFTRAVMHDLHEKEQLALKHGKPMDLDYGRLNNTSNNQECEDEVDEEDDSHLLQ